jgi:hypothetical protein
MKQFLQHLGMAVEQLQKLIELRTVILPNDQKRLLPICWHLELALPQLKPQTVTNKTSRLTSIYEETQNFLVKF